MTRKELYEAKNKQSISDFLNSLDDNFKAYITEIIKNELEWRKQMKLNEKEN